MARTQHATHTAFMYGWFIFGAAMSLETLRRTFIGGSSLSLFIIKEFGLDRQAVPTLTMLAHYLDVEKELISHLPPIVNFLVSPWRDHNTAGYTYMEILGLLKEEQRPKGCPYYWEREEES